MLLVLGKMQLVLSSSRYIVSGVPQGSIFDSLFYIYVSYCKIFILLQLSYLRYDIHSVFEISGGCFSNSYIQITLIQTFCFLMSKLEYDEAVRLRRLFGGLLGY